MVSRSTLAVSLVAVALLAGCSGFLGGETGSPEEFDHADGFSADGVDDGDRATESYVEALQAQGNYTGNYEYDVTSGGNDSVVELEYRVDFDAERGYQRFHAESEGSNGTRHLYYEDGQRYERTEAEGDVVRTDVQQVSFPADEMTAVEAIRPLLTNASAYETSVDERDGTPVVVYETSEIGNATDLYTVEEPDDVTDFEAQFAVDADGVVRTASYDLTYVSDGVEEGISLTFELSSVGETTVERPAWTDDA